MGRKNFSVYNMGYNISDNCVKLSSALVPRIKNDRSLMSVRHSDLINMGLTEFYLRILLHDLEDR